MHTIDLFSLHWAFPLVSDVNNFVYKTFVRKNGLCKGFILFMQILNGNSTRSFQVVSKC